MSDWRSVDRKAVELARETGRWIASFGGRVQIVESTKQEQRPSMYYPYMLDCLDSMLRAGFSARLPMGPVKWTDGKLDT